MTTIKLPTWREPKTKLEGDSLVLDIVNSLSETPNQEKYELILEKVFVMVVTYKGLTSKHRRDLLEILCLCGKAAIKPILIALTKTRLPPSPFAMEMFEKFIISHNIFRTYEAKVAFAKGLKNKYAKSVLSAIDENNSLGRSVIAWRNHKLYYFHTGGIVSELPQPAIIATIYELTPEERKSLIIGSSMPSSSYMEKSNTNWFTKPALWTWLISIMILWTGFCIIAAMKGW